MSVLPIVSVVRPAALTGLTNGKLPESVLTDVGPSGKLQTTAARAFLALVAAAKLAGWNITYTYGGCYRSYDRQLSLFLSRYTDTYDENVNTTSDSRFWNGKRWYKRRGVAAAATPGTSNHGWGLAVDTALDFDLSDGVGPNDAVGITPAVGWLLDNANRFGFSWELQSEPWHLRYYRGDDIPQAVIDFERSDDPVPNLDPVGETPGPLAFDPANAIYYLWAFNKNKPSLTIGSTGDAVRYLQGVLNNDFLVPRGLPKLTVDGNFGAKTESAVRAFQTHFSPLVPDGKVGPKTWGFIDYLALAQ